MRAFTLSLAGKLAILAVLTVCCPNAAVAQVAGNGDYDRDYDVDEDDFSNWAACMAGQGEHVDPWSDCAAFDFDGGSSGDTILISRADGYMLAGYTPIEPPSGQDAKKPQADQKTKKRPGPTKDPIHPDVRSKLENSEDGTVYVLVSLKPLPKEGLTREQRKAMAKEKQDKLLAKLANGDFKVDHRFAAEPRMIGYLSAGGLSKLAKQPDTPVVELSRIGDRVIPALSNSPEGKILVRVSLHLVLQGDLPLKEHIELTRQQAAKVIGRLEHDDFELVRQTSAIPSFTGYIKPSGIDILAVDPAVRKVYMSRVFEMPEAPLMRPPSKSDSSNVSQVSPQFPRRQITLNSSLESRHRVVPATPAVGYLLAGHTLKEPPLEQAKNKPQIDQKTKKKPTAKKDPIHPDVRGEIQRSGDATVYVLVTLKPLPTGGLTKDQRKAMAKEKQDKLLAKLLEGDFKVDHRFATEPRMIGQLNAGGLAKLAMQPDVRAIELSRIRLGVIAALNNSPDGKMLVMVSLQKARKNGRSLRELDLSISEYQDLIREHSSKVMDRLAHEDFEVVNQLGIIPSFIGFIKASGVEILAVDPDVRAVYLNETHHMEPTPPMTRPREQETKEVGQASPDVSRRQVALLSSMDFLDVDEVYDLGYTGAGVTVAVLDSGANCNDPVYPINCASGGASFVNGQSGTDVTDIDGHGTQVSYIIAGREQSYPGVAPDAEVLRVKIMENNYFTTFDLLQGLEYVVAEAQSRPNLRVMNLSLQTGHTYSGCNCNTADDWTIQLEDAFWKVKYTSRGRILRFL